MLVDSLPNRPLVIDEVTGLPDGSEKIADATPLTVIEGGGQAELAISFVLSTPTPAYFGLVFEKDEDAWTVVFKEVYDAKEEAKSGFGNASDAIMDYWDRQTSMEKSDEVETPDGYTFDEMTASGIDEDAYYDYFR
jgi:hypothetical protein